MLSRVVTREDTSPTNPGGDPLAALTQRMAVALSQRPEVLEGYLFGSRARGQASPHSDLDIAVFVDEALLQQSAFGYEAELTIRSVLQACPRPSVVPK